MLFNIITLFPEVFEIYLNISLFKKGKKKGIFNYNIINLREFGIGKHRKVDDYPYGGGKGMILRPEPLAKALNSISDKGIIIYFSPKGKLLNNELIKSFFEFEIKKDGNFNKEVLKKENKAFSLICGRYEGIDQRIIDNYVDLEISIGDFVLTGGELPALCFIDCVLRQCTGFLDKNALKEESFEGNLLEYPHYTRPEIFMGYKVPEVLLSGNHKEIENWRFLERVKITKENRKDLYYKFLEENYE
ncbi:MAG: tRNA (guanosine(37)-N1)-methyltransferase TrmD [Spirochaetes bacterium]|nr:tRNA (guanosine(37)-N1)-methyltransferase TrmD [Spirochaetota bacterium]